MTGADPGAVVAVKVLVEQKIIAPIGIVLEFLDFAENRPPTITGLATSGSRSRPVPDYIR
jgi:hypothetical protein